MANSSLWDTLSFRQSGTLRATTTWQFSHLTNDLVWSYTWDAENRLLSAETLPTVPTAARTKVSWVYDPAGRRIQRTVETNWTGTAYASTAARRYVYDGWQCVADLGSTNDFLRQYAWGLDLSGSTTGAGGVGGLLWVRPSGSAAQFAAFDGNGNVTALIDGATGSFSPQYEYDTFGNTLRMTGVGTLAQDNGFRFSTKRADDLVGFILYEYRPYSPTLGRWPTTPTQHGSSRKNSAPRQGSIRA
jgi:RHS repeat-associated protein